MDHLLTVKAYTILVKALVVEASHACSNCFFSIYSHLDLHYKFLRDQNISYQKHLGRE